MFGEGALSDLALLRTLYESPSVRVAFCTSNGSNGLGQEVPNDNVVIPPGEWRTVDFWEGQNQTLQKLKPMCVIFDAPYEEVPTEAFPPLRELGVRHLVFREQQGWRAVKNKISIQWAGAAKGVAQNAGKVFRKIESISIKVILKLFGVHLHDIIGTGYIPEGGFCYKAVVPRLRPYGDFHETQKNAVLLFEEDIRLLLNQPHTAIRDRGVGRASLWLSDLYFSSTDNSDPNTNGRRYRYLLLSGWRAIFRPLFRHTSPAAFMPNEGNLVEKPIVADIRYIPYEDPFEREMKNIVPLDKPRGFEKSAGPSDEIVLLISSLSPGGAERQLCYFALELKRRGEKVRVLTWKQGDTNSLHYLPHLKREGVQVDFIDKPHPEFPLKTLLGEGRRVESTLLDMLSPYFARDVWNVYTHLMVRRPKVLHCWLDYPNIVGSVAGWLSGVPQMILATRNVNPTHFAYIMRPWFKTWYDIMATSPRVRFVANSKVGAKSYAEWIGKPVDDLIVVHNGLDPSVLRAPEEAYVRAFRQSLGIGQDDLVIGGIFRLNYEKRPSLFLRVVAELRKEFPNLKAVIAGVGPLESEIAAEIDRRGLSGSVHLLGRREDIPVVMRASNLVLLTSSEEGLPNVLMEAQWLSRPVVCTDVGGCPEVVLEGATGYVCERGDARGLVKRCADLLHDSDKRRRFGMAARAFVQSKFSLENMVNNTLQAYR